MNELYPASPVMIKIDGAKVKAIREAKGLTQLYVATVVEVTTDTVSRWENKRYPTIKKENALRLAEALEVELSEILDSPEPEQPEPAAANLDEKEPSGSGAEAGRESEYRREPQPWYRRLGHLGIIVATVMLIGSGWFIYSFFGSRSTPADLSVTRIVAPHFVAGRPLPVFLKVHGGADAPVSIILKEELPPGSLLETASPPLSGNADKTIKWLTKISGPSLFFYTITTEPTFTGTLHFSGTARDAHAQQAQAIGGSERSEAGHYHWADSDGDNRISDEEILMVYDLLSGETSQIIDLDLLEEMWLGDGYLWQPQQQRFSIVQ